MSEQLDTTAAALVASKTVGYAGSTVGAASAYFGSIDWGFWISVFIALTGFAMNWYFARKKDKRDQILFEERLKKARGERDVK